MQHPVKSYTIVVRLVVSCKPKNSYLERAAPLSEGATIVLEVLGNYLVLIPWHALNKQCHLILILCQ